MAWIFNHDGAEGTYGFALSLLAGIRVDRFHGQQSENREDLGLSCRASGRRQQTGSDHFRRRIKNLGLFVGDSRVAQRLTWSEIFGAIQHVVKQIVDLASGSRACNQQESIRRWMEFSTPGTGNSGIITVRYLTYSLIDNRGKLAVWLVR